MGEAESDSGWEPPSLRRSELRLQLVGDLRALIALPGQLGELRLNLRTEQRAKLVGVDDVRLIALVHPRRQPLPIVPRRLQLATVAQKLPQRDPQRQLGFLHCIQLAGLGPDPPDDLCPIELGPARRIDHQRELVMDPTGKRTFSPVRLEKLVRFRKVDASDRLAGSLGEEFLEVILARAKLFFIGDGDLPQFFFGELQPETIVDPVHKGLPGPFRPIGIGRQVLLDRLANRVAQLSLGLRLGELDGVFRSSPL